MRLEPVAAQSSGQREAANAPAYYAYARVTRRIASH
jgi:hypothetical protein